MFRATTFQTCLSFASSCAYPRNQFRQDEGLVEETPMPINETERLQALYRYQILDTPPEPTLDELTQLAADICQTPIALISLVDADRQWFKSRVGLECPETKREISFCTHAILQPEPLVVHDAQVDPRFGCNALVVESPWIRFYAGVPLLTPDNLAIGTLCVIDYVPRELTQHQYKALQALSHQIMSQLEHRYQRIQQAQTDAQEDLIRHPELILFRLASQIRNSLDLDTTLQTAVTEIRNLLQIDRCHFMWGLPHPAQPGFVITHEACAPELPSLIGDLSTSQAAILAETVFNAQVLRVDQVGDTADSLDPEMQSMLLQQGIASQLLLPLKTHAGQIGAIVCSHCRGTHLWTDAEVKLLQAVTDQLAIAIDQAEMFAQSRSAAFAAQTQAQYLREALQKLQQTQAQLVQHEKMSSLGQLVAGVAHEINNPVNFISGNITYANDYILSLLELLQLYQQHYPDPVAPIQAKAEEIDLDFMKEDLPKLLASMQIGTERIRQIVLSLRNFSRLDEAEKKPAHIHEGIDSTLLILQNRLKEPGDRPTIQVIKEYGDLPQVECYPGQLNQVFMNILSNAIESLEEKSGPRTITIRTATVSPANSPANSPTDSAESTHPQAILIRIQDNGMGMTDGVMARLFDPFFTTKSVGKGTGLGLSISYQIVVEKHQGLLECVSAPGEGTEFWIQIPLVPS